MRNSFLSHKIAEAVGDKAGYVRNSNTFIF